MSRSILCATALALALGGVAHAQPATSSDTGLRGPQSSATDNSLSPPREADPAPPTAAAPSEALTPGMPVKDKAGETVGVINRVGQTADGTPAVEVNVDGKPVAMAMAALTLAPTRDQAISSISRAEAQAAAGRSAP